MRPAIIAVGGFTSNTGKTTLVCELLRALRGWEAIKMTRGHYRSCGRDPHACCVSHLLGAEPLVLSGREATYAAGKDTGRFWDAGASNVHWVVATDAQVGRGVEAALSRVRARGVLVEGNSFLEHVRADYAIMVARPDSLKIKPTARRALSKTSALYVSQDGDAHDPALLESFLLGLRGVGELPERAPVHTRATLASLIAQVRAARTREEFVKADVANRREASGER
jgi:molybdopterin-guanine dinucleotide biosynthesis protein